MLNRDGMCAVPFNEVEQPAFRAAFKPGHVVAQWFTEIAEANFLQKVWVVGNSAVKSFILQYPTLLEDLEVPVPRSESLYSFTLQWLLSLMARYTCFDDISDLDMSDTVQEMIYYFDSGTLWYLAVKIPGYKFWKNAAISVSSLQKRQPIPLEE